ncbi:MAG: tetratricopeptide repeat protein [Mariniphaga sp.]|nr:tetratricopeptide repeat protein [Mariniphaga sp.]
MRIITSIILFLLAIPAISQEDKMEEASRLYTEEQFQQAVAIYEEILQEGKESAQLYFNLGNAYYKSGDANMAILNYERAKLLAPNDEDIDFNLQIANQYVVTSVEALPQPFFVRWSNSIINTNSADSWARISLISFILFLVLFGLFIFSKTVGIKRIAFIFGIVCIILSLTTFSFASKQKSKINTRNHAIVFCPRVTVKSSPSETGTDLFLIYEGLKVEITDSISNWKEVKLLDGNQGWLQDSCIVRI